MNTSERTRTARPRNRRWGWGLLALLLVLALGLGIWFAFLRQTPKERFLTALDQSFAPEAYALDEDSQLRGFQAKLAEGYRVDLHASIPAEDYGAMSFQLEHRAQPAEALQLTEARLGMGQFDLFAGALYSDAERLQFRLGSAERAESYELDYADSELAGFREAWEAHEWTEVDQETRDALEAELSKAKEALYEDLEVEAAGRKTVQVDGEDEEAEIYTWRATNDDLTAYLDRIESILAPQLERLDPGNYLGHLPTDLVPEDLDVLEQQASFVESYAELKRKLEEAELELTGEALIVGEHVYELTLDTEQMTEEATGPYRYRSYRSDEPGSHVELSYPDGSQLELTQTAPVEGVSDWELRIRVDGEVRGAIGFRYRDGAVDGRYELSLTELMVDGEDLVETLDLQFELVTELLPIPVLSDTPVDVANFAEDDWASIWDSMGPLFGGLPSGFE